MVKNYNIITNQLIEGLIIFNKKKRVDCLFIHYSSLNNTYIFQSFMITSIYVLSNNRYDCANDNK